MRSAEEIIEKLRGSFNAPRTKDEKIKVVIFCIVISTTFWFFSALNKSDYVTQINYPIEFRYNTERFVAIEPLPRYLRLEVAGGGWDLMTRSFGFGMAPIIISLDDPSQANFKLTSTLRGELTPKLEPVTVNYVLSDSIYYYIEPIISRTVALGFDSASVQLAPDYRFVSPVDISPAEVTFTGPESLVQAIEEPYVIPANDDSYEEMVGEVFDLPEQSSKLISSDITEATVSFEVDEFVPYQRAIKVMRLNFLDSTLRLSPEAVDVTYTIKRSEEVHSDSLDIMLIADFFTFNSEDSSVEVSVAVKAAHVHDLVLLDNKLKVESND